MTEFEVLPEIELGKCANCPIARPLSVTYSDLTNGLTNVAVEFMDSSFSGRAQDIFEHIVAPGIEQGMIPFDPILEREVKTADDIEESLRQTAIEMMNEQDERVSNLGEQLKTMLSQCNEGPLKMRAQKAGKQIMVTVCNSAFHEDGEYCEHVTVERSDEPKTK